MTLPLLILACLAYGAYAAATLIRAKARRPIGETNGFRLAAAFLLGGGLPLVVATTMTGLFFVAGGSTTVQLNAGSPSHTDVWTTWVTLWPAFLVLSAMSALGWLVWTGVCALDGTRRPALPVALASLGLSVLAFFAVATYFPSA